MDRKTFAKIVVFWLISLASIFGYIISEYLIHGKLLGFTSTSIYLSLTSSVIWVPLSFLFTVIFGGLIVEFLLKLLAHKKLLRRTLVVPAEEQLEKLSTEQGRVEASAKLMLKIFVLVFAVNFIYVLFLSSRGWVPRTDRPYLIFTQVESVVGLLFLPLLTLVLPLSVGKIKVRQVDNRPVDSYWLWLILAIAGGIGIVLLLLQGNVLILIIPPAFLFAICSWHAALGAMLALPIAQKMLAARLLRMRGHERVIFGKIWAGASKEEAIEV